MGLKYKVEMPKLVHWATELDPRTEWCCTNFGKSEKRWQVIGWSPRTYSFSKESDATMFALRWVGAND